MRTPGFSFLEKRKPTPFGVEQTLTKYYSQIIIPCLDGKHNQKNAWIRTHPGIGAAGSI